MNNSALIFMLVIWGGAIALTVFCYKRLLTGNKNDS